MRRITGILLWTACAWLWTSIAFGQHVAFTSTGADYGQITIAPHADSVKIDQQLKVAVDSLKNKAGLLLDFRRVNSSGQMYTPALAKAVNFAFAEYTKPTVVLFGGSVDWESDLGKWAKEREWTRFESSGELKKAEAKLKTLHGRYLREGQERMDWLMQQKAKEKN